jgi:hypothetical protein
VKVESVRISTCTLANSPAHQTSLSHQYQEYPSENKNLKMSLAEKKK